ncbi:MAG: hypothetical protein D6698_15475 [Gammaproteobacteria bacterium]|nr:MAG: hypothetical protein D6698_15475 [Gammaproteobacteria bacterium]
MIGFLIGGIATAVIAQAATPATADFTCWMTNASGQVVDMSYMCQSSTNHNNLDIPAISIPDPGETTIAELPMAGTVCLDFATQGEAQYHYWLGSAPSSLGSDPNSIVCRELSYISNRTDGSRVDSYRSTRYQGVDIELFDAGRRNIDGDFYLRVTAPSLGIFTTRSFADKPAAYEHMRLYYGYTQGI